MSHIIYVQLDKCFAQFREGTDGEDNKELQLLLSMMADINDEKVQRQLKGNKMLEDIYTEVFRMAQDREVQAMWFAEKYVDADWNAAKEFQRRKGIKEGKKEMALELLKNGVAPDIIAASAEVSVETVEQWEQQSKNFAEK